MFYQVVLLLLYYSKQYWNTKYIPYTSQFQIYNVNGSSDTVLINTLYKYGPVGHYIVANCSTFQLYSSGIYNTNCIGNVDHAVMSIGYNNDYYIIRNSWGSSWGQNGYMNMKRVIGDDKTNGINQILINPLTIF